MNRIKKCPVALLITLVCALCFVGCETSSKPDTEGVDSYFDENPVGVREISDSQHLTTRALGITASRPALPNNGDYATLTVTGGSPPFYWVVENSGLGSLRSTTGAVVHYQRGAAAGENVISVVDRYGGVGRIVITSN